ncbi:replication protein [Halomonas elongata]|uniref:replication protein n=1 Tax=Halomonas elongata TaxID=2746 RepID=UPI004033CFF9
MADTAEIFQFPDRREDGQTPGPDRSGRSPQVEDGFVRIATELHQALARSRMTGNERAVVDTVIRFTYGYQRTEARITGETFAQWTGMDSSDCSSIVTELVRRRILLRAGSRSPIRLNKDYSQWLKPKGASRRVHRKSPESGEKHPTREAAPKSPESGENGPTETGENRPTYKDRKDIPPLPSVEGEPSSDPEPQPAEPKAKPQAKSKANAYPDEFEKLWALYPKRGGGNPKKPAYRAWCARLNAGVAAETLHAAVERYAAFIRAKGDERTEFVMQAQRFLGPNGEFENDWTPPANRQTGRLGMVQPKPQGSYTPTPDMDNLPDWMRD